MVVLNNNYAQALSPVESTPHNAGYPVTLLLYAKEEGVNPDYNWNEERLLKKTALLPFPPFPGMWIKYEQGRGGGGAPWEAKVSDVCFYIETGEVTCHLGDVDCLDLEGLLADGWTRRFPEAEPAPKPLKRKPRKRLQTPAGQRNGNEIKQIVQG